MNAAMEALAFGSIGVAVITLPVIAWALLRLVALRRQERSKQAREYVPASEVIASCRAKLRSNPIRGNDNDGQEANT